MWLCMVPECWQSLEEVILLVDLVEEEVTLLVDLVVVLLGFEEQLVEFPELHHHHCCQLLLLQLVELGQRAQWKK